jgi:hypothetical protein
MDRSYRSCSSPLGLPSAHGRGCGRARLSGAHGEAADHEAGGVDLVPLAAVLGDTEHGLDEHVEAALEDDGAVLDEERPGRGAHELVRVRPHHLDGEPDAALPHLLGENFAERALIRDILDADGAGLPAPRARSRWSICSPTDQWPRSQSSTKIWRPPRPLSRSSG